VRKNPTDVPVFFENLAEYGGREASDLNYPDGITTLV